MASTTAKFGKKLLNISWKKKGGAMPEAVKKAIFKKRGLKLLQQCKQSGSV